MKYTIVAGTFEYLHAGHRHLIEKAFNLKYPVVIGLTTDEYANAKRNRVVKPYDQRLNQLLDWLATEHSDWCDWSEHTIHPLNDWIGMGMDPEATNIVCSPETVVSVQRLNELRRKEGTKSLIVHVVPFALATDGQPISSTRIANGEI